MLDKLRDFFNNKKVLILGYGLEGQSTFRLLEKLDCAALVTAWENYHHTTKLPDDYDIIMKSPGIPMFGNSDPRITGQTDLFLRFCENKTIGITGTKGKSTTSSLIHHILTQCSVKSKLIGNIGVPPLDVADELGDNVIVMELSCHQLEYVQASPKIAVLLNIYEEHLDHYVDFDHYRAAKENIFKFHKAGDVLIRGEEADISALDPTMPKLRGEHNLKNIAVAVKVAMLLGCSSQEVIKAAYDFSGLEHRLELLTDVNGVKYVNDSISTIPAATIAAVEAFPETDTVIIGGMDRGIDYSSLINFLNDSDIPNIIALPDSGHTIAEKLNRVRKVNNMEEAVAYARQVTRKCCVLSPAAASYGVYKNFEERGRHFKELVVGERFA
ncbi:MAG: UDP-N-acetylmuramoyl-L-alanine--D-glutamate ligase [Oscillospiraceae bacterium]|nr:UDP-N-acetylmuramoyl-L-alanine--D-glutamate ligase [Oscillospiraceae bacterium]